MLKNEKIRMGREKKFSVIILLDASNNWIEPFIHDSGLLHPQPRFNISLIHDPEQVVDAHIVFVLGYTKILDNSFLSKNELTLVVHESELPSGRGFSPVQWQILEGKTSVPVCLIEASEQVDAGDIIGRASIELDGYELYDEIRDKQAKATIEVLREFLHKYPSFNREAQTGTAGVYPRRLKSDSELDVDASIRDQFDLLRVSNNEEWPSHFYLDGKKFMLKIFKD